LVVTIDGGGDVTTGKPALRLSTLMPFPEEWQQNVRYQEKSREVLIKPCRFRRIWVRRGRPLAIQLVRN
jgi:hypothetical protein